MTVGKLKKVYFCWGKFYANKFAEDLKFPEAWTLCLERSVVLIKSIPVDDIKVKESLIDAFLQGAGETLRKNLPC